VALTPARQHRAESSWNDDALGEHDAEVQSMSESHRQPACDPVCGRELSEEHALLSIDVDGDTYLFCSERCRMLFSVRPGWFLERTEPRPARRAS
jgi:YHS domain-containing protein